MAFALPACGGNLPPSAVPRPIGEDLPALVPSGAELIVDVDVQQLRAWPEIDRLLGLLPPAGRERLDRLGPQWLSEIDGLAVAASRSEGRTRTLVVMRCDLDDARLPALLEGTAVRAELNGRTLFESGEEAVLRLSPRLVVVGSQVEVRRVSEIMRGEAEGLRDARADRALRDALAKAPAARTGRPAVLGAAIAGPLMTDRFEAAGLGGRGPSAAAFALAVGDGLDAVLVLSLGSAQEATALRGDLDKSLRDLRQRPIVRVLGLEGALELASVVRDRDLRIAYRLAGTKLDGYLGRLERAKKALEARGRPAP